MSGSDLGPGDASRGRRVERAVEATMQRQRRLVLVYAVLLLIPLGLAIMYQLYGRTDREVVREEVQTRVAPIEKAVQETKPAVAEAKAALEQGREQQARVERLLQDQEDVRVQLAGLREELPRIRSFSTQGAEWRVALAALRSQIEEQTNQLRRISDEQSRIVQEQTRLDREIRAVRERTVQLEPARLDQVMRRVEELNRRVERVEAPPPIR